MILKPGFIHNIKCFDEKLTLVWNEVIHNLVPTEGLNDFLDEYLEGSSYTAAHYVGLKSTGDPALADTMSSHSGWTELTIYSEAARQTLSWSAASNGSKVGDTVSFSINASGTVGGTLISTNSTKGGTTGTLISAANFSSSHTVASGYTLTDDITFTLSN